MLDWVDCVLREFVGHLGCFLSVDGVFNVVDTVELRMDVDPLFARAGLAISDGSVSLEHELLMLGPSWPVYQVCTGLREFVLTV